MTDRLDSAEALPRHLERPAPARSAPRCRCRAGRGVRNPPLTGRALPGWPGSSPASRCRSPAPMRSGGGSRCSTGALDPVSYLTLSEEAVRGARASRVASSARCAVIAEAMVAGSARFRTIWQTLPAEEAVAALTTLKGIGPWTAEIYLMFCAGASGHLSGRRSGAAERCSTGSGLTREPPIKDLIDIAAALVAAPLRRGAAVLALLSRVMRDREGLSICDQALRPDAAARIAAALRSRWWCCCTAMAPTAAT